MKEFLSGSSKNGLVRVALAGSVLSAAVLGYWNRPQEIRAAGNAIIQACGDMNYDIIPGQSNYPTGVEGQTQTVKLNLKKGQLTKIDGGRMAINSETETNYDSASKAVIGIFDPAGAEVSTPDVKLNNIYNGLQVGSLVKGDGPMDAITAKRVERDALKSAFDNGRTEEITYKTFSARSNSSEAAVITNNVYKGNEITNRINVLTNELNTECAKPTATPTTIANPGLKPIPTPENNQYCAPIRFENGRIVDPNSAETPMQYKFEAVTGKLVVLSTGDLKVAGQKFVSTEANKKVYFIGEHQSNYEVELIGKYSAIMEAKKISGNKTSNFKEVNGVVATLAQEDLKKGTKTATVVYYNGPTGELLSSDVSLETIVNATKANCEFNVFVPQAVNKYEVAPSAPVNPGPEKQPLNFSKFRPVSGAEGFYAPDVSKDNLPNGEFGKVVPFNEESRSQTSVLWQLPWIKISNENQQYEKGYNNNGQVLVRVGENVKLSDFQYKIETLAGIGVRTEGFSSPETTANRDLNYKSWMQWTKSYIKNGDKYTLINFYKDQNGKVAVEVNEDVDPFSFANLNR